jgi:ABC-2 type transport system permease protein
LRWNDAVNDTPRLLPMDVRELFGSTAFSLLLLIAGPLTGAAFIAAVRAYAEASGGGGGAAALASALSPLDGILVPTLGACDLLITFLAPFVAIRLVSAEKGSGAHQLLLQTPSGLASRLLSKVVALLLGWLACLAPAGVALLLWRSYGGHLAFAETANLLLGHTLRYLVTCCLALAAAAMLDGAASAAIAVLSVTIGTWALDFFAAGRGGWIAAVARYTPAAALRQFERGLLSLGLVLTALVTSLLLLFVAAAFLDLRTSTRTRAIRVAGATLVACVLFGTLRSERSVDLAEDRRSSFSAADERLLRGIRMPVTIRIHLAAEDPRANDYERNVLTKLRRTLPDLRVEYPYAGRSALFDSDQRYGTIVYRVGTNEAVSRSSTEEIVLDELETLAGLTPPPRGEAAYPGYPLNAAPRGAAAVFYGVWPLLAGLWWWLQRRR